VKVRAYEERDRGELERLAKLLLPEDEGRIPNDEIFFVIDREDGRLGGYVDVGMRSYAEGCDSSPVPYIEAWYVDEDLRRQGWGAKLFAAAESWASARGHTELASDVRIDNATSIAAHKALGFTEHERVVCFAKRLARPPR
jgi:aminoglycoside 6'-N-acetyltransferase I